MPAVDPRFASLGRLYGNGAIPKFAAAHVAIIGLGGVGSWTVEALARSAVGTLTLIDLDDLCLTNVNRQLPALTSTVGHPKVAVLARRIADIHPGCRVHSVEQFLTPTTAATLLDQPFDAVIDATDRTSTKALILDECRRRNLRAITVGAAGGKLDPTQVAVADLGLAGKDDLLRLVRRKLRRDHGWEAGEGNNYRVPAIFSPESPRYPWADGTVRLEEEPGSNLAMDCATGFGAAAHVTGTFGLFAASEALKILFNRKGGRS
jgi:tRNA A37 threonylcarbamoyladenosine dehydratase